jgi:hypothetical protein
MIQQLGTLVNVRQIAEHPTNGMHFSESNSNKPNNI